MKLEISLAEKDSELVERMLREQRFEDVDELFRAALHRLSQDETEEISDEEMAKAAEEGYASGWYEGDPFQAAREVIARVASREKNAA